MMIFDKAMHLTMQFAVTIGSKKIQKNKRDESQLKQ